MKNSQLFFLSTQMFLIASGFELTFSDLMGSLFFSFLAFVNFIGLAISIIQERSIIREMMLREQILKETVDHFLNSDKLKKESRKNARK